MSSTTHKFVQEEGEHMQAFAYRVHTALEPYYTDEDKLEKQVCWRVLVGMLPEFYRKLPLYRPTTFDELFSWYDKIRPPIVLKPARTAGEAPDISITFKNDNCKHAECYKCGQKGHYAKFCENERVKGLKPRKTKLKRLSSKDKPLSRQGAV